jgi:hypothetical protein
MLRSADRTAYVVVVAAGALCALVLAAVLNPWLDEGYTLLSTGSGVSAALHRALVFEWQPPLYFVALSAWRNFGGSVFLARLPSVACYLVLLALVPALVRRYADGVPVAAVAAAFAVAPFALEVAVEMRPYALALALTAVFLVTLSDAFLVPKRPRTATVICAASAIGIVYTHYYAAAILVGGACAVALAGDRTRRRAALIAASSVVIAVLPLTAIVGWQMHASRIGREMLGAIDIVNIVTEPLRFATANAGSHSLRIAIVLVTLLAITLVVVRRGPLRTPPIALTLVGSTVALVTLIILDGTHPEMPRYAIALFVPAVLTPFGYIARSREAARIAVAWTTVVVICALGSDALAYRPLAKAGDWYRIAAYIDRHGPQHATIVIYPQGDELAAAAAIGPPHQVIALPAAVNPDRPPTPDGIHDPVVAAALLARASHDGPIWLAEPVTCLPTSDCDAVDAAVRNRFRVLDEQRFYLETLRLISTQPKLPARGFRPRHHRSLAAARATHD